MTISRFQPAPPALPASRRSARPLGAAPGTGAPADSLSVGKLPPMHLAFDVYLDEVTEPAQRAQLLQGLKGQLKKGDTVWLAVEDHTVAKDPQILDTLAAEKQKWLSVLGPEGVNVQTRIRFERIHTDRASSVQPGMQNIYDSILMARKREHKPIADAISYDYEAFAGFSGNEYTPHDTANAAHLFAQGQHIARELGTSYFVEPSVSGVGPHVDPLHHVTLDWRKLTAYTDGFNFQTQRIVGGSAKMNLDPATLAADRRAYGHSVGQLVEGLSRNVNGKKDWAMAQISTEWSQPRTVVAAAATARNQAPDIKAYYIWWFDPGRSEQANAEHLLAMLHLWNRTFHRDTPPPDAVHGEIEAAVARLKAVLNEVE